LKLARHFHCQLTQVADFFRERQRSYHFYASSLLFVYDYDVISQIEKEAAIGYSNLELTNHVRVKLIDFAHVFPAEEGRPDGNFLFGVENLRDLFRHFIAQHTDELS
jgi:1D-myo-inositol-tetrakisphosphate 5-kinase/inositol-polyphosphate multikinase